MILMHKSLRFAFLAALLPLCGCQTIKDQPLIAQVAVQYATIKVVQDHPERAARVVEIARTLRTSAEDEAATVALLEVLIRAKINWASLDAADRLLVDTLIIGVRQELLNRLGDGVLSAENKLVVAQVAGWIEAAALSVTPATTP